MNDLTNDRVTGESHSEASHACDTCPQRAESRTLTEERPIKIHRRFDRLARLVGDDGVTRLSRAHVVVFGCGGVGSFAAESLARSGVGRITLVDFDLVCVTNTNRQLHAMKGTIGKPKVEIMAERLRLIHPTARVDAVRAFYEASTRDELLPSDSPPDFVIDAIDNVTAKLDLLSTCASRGIPVIASMGAAGRMDPTRVRVDDMANTFRDPFAKDVRRLLVRKYGVVPKEDGTLGIPAVFSDELVTAPADVSSDLHQGFLCVCPHGENEHHGCEHRARIDGSASFVTGVFGLVAAGHVVRAIADPSSAKRTLSTRKRENGGGRRKTAE